MGMDQIRVLLVDDEEDLVATLSERLEIRGFRVTGVHSGIEALQCVEEHPFDIVLMDVRMPGLDGMETMKQMKLRWPGLPVILVTGHLPESAAEDAQRLGAFDFFNKPVDLKQLTARIHDAVQVVQSGAAHE